MNPSGGDEAEQIPDRQEAIAALLAEMGTYTRQGICALADGRYEALPGLAEKLHALGRQLLGGRTPIDGPRLEALCRRLERSRQGPTVKRTAMTPNRREAERPAH
jgi:hypothetical protein